MRSVAASSCVYGVFVLTTDPKDNPELSVSTRVTVVLNIAVPFTKVVHYLDTSTA